MGIYAIVGLSYAFLLAVPLWSTRYRKHPQKLPKAFRRGLYMTSALLVVILPLQGILLALALYLADPAELWFWGIFVAAGSLAGTVVLVNSDLNSTPGIYLTLRARRLDLKDHPKLSAMLSEISEALQVPLPPHSLVGLQPELLATIGTVFCPAGELEGGTLCFSLPTSSVVSVSEFRSLTGEALLALHAGLNERRKDFLSSSEGAADVLRSLDESRREWSWFPKWGIHPFLVVVRLVAVAAMRFPLYLGREWITFFVNEFWVARKAADADRSLCAHRVSTAEAGAINAISALIKEAAVSLGPCFDLSEKDQPWQGLGEVAERVSQEHPELLFDLRAASRWTDPATAWNYLQFRCNLSTVSLEWCRRIALDVNPYDPALLLFENAASLEATLIEAAREPFVIAGSQAS
jgi:hypothetical protein